MLVLTRSTDQEIRIGQNIVVRVLEVKGDRVRIGIDAPPTVAVHRQEVFLEIERANRAALDVAGAGLESARALLEKKRSRAGNRKNDGRPETRRGRAPVAK
jgi:carbon storage regulator